MFDSYFFILRNSFNMFERGNKLNVVGERPEHSAGSLFVLYSRIDAFINLCICIYRVNANINCRISSKFLNQLKEGKTQPEMFLTHYSGTLFQIVRQLITLLKVLLFN